jgi:hypothetical protein
MDPAVMTLNFDIGAKNINYIDLAKVASEVNRRFYRQGMNYAVAGFRVGYVGDESPTVAIRTLPNTWSTGASWHKFFAAWKRQQDQALIESGSPESKARYNDFKIWADTYHKTAEPTGSLSAINPGGFSTAGNTPYKAGEWSYSYIVVPHDPTSGATKEYSLHMIGNDASTTKGMIHNFALSRNLPFSPDPNTPAIDTGVLSEMFDVGETFDEVLDNVVDRNDDVPYDLDEYPDGSTNPGTGVLPLHREMQFTATTIGNFQNIEGCVVPCGILQIAQNLSAPADYENSWLTLQVMMIPGSYKGYLAEPMQVMN